MEWMLVDWMVEKWVAWTGLKMVGSLVMKMVEWMECWKVVMMVCL